MARNMTLLFFLERLLDRGEPRTLHDLSCQFGARGFTKEMRQIAGGSQSGWCQLIIFYQQNTLYHSAFMGFLNSFECFANKITDHHSKKKNWVVVCVPLPNL